MRVAILFPFFLFASLVCAQSAMPTLAVLDFENNSFYKSEEVQSLAKGLAEIMITEISNAGSISVVERQRLRHFVDELKLSQTGMTSEEGSLKVGKLSGAQYLVFGSYMVMSDDKIRMDVRIVAVETGLTVKAAEVTGRTKDVLSLVHKLSNTVLRDLNIRLAEKNEKAFGKISLEALKIFSKGIEFEDRREPVKAVACYRKALALDPGFEQAKERMEKLSQE